MGRWCHHGKRFGLIPTTTETRIKKKNLIPTESDKAPV